MFNTSFYYHPPSLTAQVSKLTTLLSFLLPLLMPCPLQATPRRCCSSRTAACTASWRRCTTACPWWGCPCSPTSRMCWCVWRSAAWPGACPSKRTRTRYTTPSGTFSPTPGKEQSVVWRCAASEYITIYSVRASVTHSQYCSVHCRHVALLVSLFVPYSQLVRNILLWIHQYRPMYCSVYC